MKGDKEMICKTCGGSNVRRDADVMWNIGAQCWETAGIYDNATCDDCGGETTIVERTIPEPPSNLQQARALWAKLGDVPIDDNGCCMAPFVTPLHTFDAGTHREEIWHWFEHTFDVSVAVDLMFYKTLTED